MGFSFPNTVFFCCAQREEKRHSRSSIQTTVVHVRTIHTSTMYLGRGRVSGRSPAAVEPAVTSADRLIAASVSATTRRRNAIKFYSNFLVAFRRTRPLSRVARPVVVGPFPPVPSYAG